MKMKYILAILVFVVGLLSSCYEDKGNYDYQIMNDITITLPLPDGNDVFVLGDEINIQPELTFSQGWNLNLLLIHGLLMVRRFLQNQF